MFKGLNTYYCYIPELHRCRQNNVCIRHTKLRLEYKFHCCYTCSCQPHTLYNTRTARGTTRPVHERLYTCLALDARILELENVAIANALQLEAARRRAVPIRFNFVARAKF